MLWVIFQKLENILLTKLEVHILIFQATMTLLCLRLSCISFNTSVRKQISNYNSEYKK